MLCTAQNQRIAKKIWPLKKIKKDDNRDKSKSVVNPSGKKENENSIPEKIAEKKQKKPINKPTGFVPSAVGASAVDAVKAGSSKDVRGSSGLANTGTIISYD